jgi:hypothetical protein
VQKGKQKSENGKKIEKPKMSGGEGFLFLSIEFGYLPFSVTGNKILNRGKHRP